MQRMVGSQGIAFIILVLDLNYQESNLQIISKQSTFLELGGKHLSMFLCSLKQLQHYYSVNYPIMISSGEPETHLVKIDGPWLHRNPMSQIFPRRQSKKLNQPRSIYSSFCLGLGRICFSSVGPQLTAMDSMSFDTKLKRVSCGWRVSKRETLFVHYDQNICQLSFQLDFKYLKQ